jgi:predicted RNA-binding protein Jag
MSDPQTVVAEGRTVRDAVLKAAELLGVAPAQVQHKLDLSHFRTPDGRVRPVDTVQVIAWIGAAAPAPASAPAAPRAPAADAGPALDNSGALAAAEWTRTLLGHMGVDGMVRSRVNGEKRGEVRIDSAHARHLVGRRGTTLRAIRDLMAAGLQGAHEGWTFELSVEGGREDDRPRDDRPRDDRPRDDRPRDDRPRDDRPRDDRRDDRRRDDRPRDDRRDGGGRDSGGRSDRDAQALRRLAVRLAREAIETGEPVRFRRELNSFERRVVHMAVSEVPGVRSESEGDGAMKNIVLIPDGAEE